MVAGETHDVTGCWLMELFCYVNAAELLLLPLKWGNEVGESVTFAILQEPRLLPLPLPTGKRITFSDSTNRKQGIRICDIM
jgi:hypothetical protein